MERFYSLCDLRLYVPVGTNAGKTFAKIKIQNFCFVMEHAQAFKNKKRKHLLLMLGVAVNSGANLNGIHSVNTLVC